MPNIFGRLGYHNWTKEATGGLLSDAINGQYCFGWASLKRPGGTDRQRLILTPPLPLLYWLLYGNHSPQSHGRHDLGWDPG